MSNDISVSTTVHANQRADKWLRISMSMWFLVATIGLLLFAYYIAAHYGGTAIKGDYEAWSKTSIKGFVSGDFWGNLFFISHMLLAFIITLGGIVQLVPRIRKRWLHIHRWNGRLFILTSFLICIGGLYLIWIRESSLHRVGAIAITINALLIFFFGGKAWLTARGHEVQSHRRWALRTFVVVSGVWFYRIGFMGWIIINQGPVGSTDNLDGPFDLAWSFLNYLLPLAVLEAYFYFSSRSSNTGKYFMAGMMFFMTLLTATGIVGAYLFMWQPSL